MSQESGFGEYVQLKRDERSGGPRKNGREANRTIPPALTPPDQISSDAVMKAGWFVLV